MLELKPQEKAEEVQKEKVLIIGSGPAGFTAGIYLARANMEPLMLEGFMTGGMPGGQLMVTDEVENFPGFEDGVGGQALMGKMRQHALNAGVRMNMVDATSVDFSSRPFKATDQNGVTYSADSVIIATGATAKRLVGVVGEDTFWNKGISACAVCDGALPIFRDKPLAVVGGGDTALEEAEHLTKFGSKVYLIVRRDEFRASKVLQKRILGNDKIEVLWSKSPVEFVGDTVLEGVKLKDNVTGEESLLPVNGCFEAIGHRPNTGFLDGQLATDAVGYLTVNPGTNETSVAGVFAAGDVQDPVYRQAIIAAGSGAQCALTAERWMLEQE